VTRIDFLLLYNYNRQQLQVALVTSYHPCVEPSATSTCPMQANAVWLPQTAKQYTLTITLVAPYQYHFTVQILKICCRKCKLYETVLIQFAKNYNSKSLLANRNQPIRSNPDKLPALSDQHVLCMKIHTQQPIFGLDGLPKCGPTLRHYFVCYQNVYSQFQNNVLN